MRFWKKNGKKFPTFIFKEVINIGNTRIFSNANLPVIGRHMDGRIKMVKKSPKSS